jgi:hypothetical protein
MGTRVGSYMAFDHIILRDLRVHVRLHGLVLDFEIAALRPGLWTETGLTERCRE